jgi:hypothetical protein
MVKKQATLIVETDIDESYTDATKSVQKILNQLASNHAERESS